MRRQAVAIPEACHTGTTPPQDMEGEKREYRKENLNEGE